MFDFLAFIYKGITMPSGCKLIILSCHMYMNCVCVDFDFYIRHLFSWFPILASKILALVFHMQKCLSASTSLSFFFSVLLNHSSFNLFFSFLYPFCFDSFSVCFFLFSCSFLFPSILLNVHIGFFWVCPCVWLADIEWFLCIEAWVPGGKTVLSITLSTLCWSNQNLWSCGEMRNCMLEQLLPYS